VAPGVVAPGVVAPGVVAPGVVAPGVVAPDVVASGVVAVHRGMGMVASGVMASKGDPNICLLKYEILSL